jgi:alkylation response protein AidB-like acyl-CoA dehydrogenase
MKASERAMGLGLRALTRLAGARLIDRAGLRAPTERLVNHATRNGFRTAGTVGRTFGAAQRLARPERQAIRERGALFDLTPTDEQLMMRAAMREFGASELRPIAADADGACAAPAALLAQSAELGVTGLGVPEELGGAVGERSAVTTVLVAEALAHGDMGIAAAALAPAAVATAIGLWGDADQQSTYLPELVGDDVPAAALAVLEPRPLFDPFELHTRARRGAEGGYLLEGEKSLVPRAVDCELFVVAAELEGHGPALFVVESRTAGVTVEPEPAMGVRAAATGRLALEGVRLASGSLLGEASAGAYAEAVRRARIGWCALAVGTAQAVLDHVTSYVNDRNAFGEPISHRQAVAFNVADIAIELEGMRLTTYRAAALADQGADFAREAAVARQLCARRGMTIGSDGVGLLGGHGFVKEHPVERWYRDLRAAGLMEGALLV